ncbi:MAG: GNAT family N-acetyltransferase [Eubacterium sp.]|nr:GNAT family N-acetyltransferase [Eubacterium sp.]
MIIRNYQSSDCNQLAELFYNTVHTINAKDYSNEQLGAWAPDEIDLLEWNTSLLNHYSIVAVKDDVIVGFGDIDKNGYLDRLYVHKDYQNQGIATTICDNMENAVDVDRITTHASITARPFFLHRGYKQIKEQQVVRDGIVMTNFIMEK